MDEVATLSICLMLKIFDHCRDSQTEEFSRLGLGTIPEEIKEQPYSISPPRSQVLDLTS